MKAYINSILNFLKKYWGFIVFFALYVLITYLFHVTSCMTKLIFGIPCPGCGLSRAFMVFIRFDFKSVIYYNATLLIMPLLIFVIIFKDVNWVGKIYKNRWFWVTVLLVSIGYYIYRMIVYFPNYPMNYYPNNLISFVNKFIQNIIH